MSGRTTTHVPTQAEIEKINKSKPGILVKYAKVISKGKRVPADESALNAANATPGVSGEQKVPFVSLHTEYDADAIVQNEGAVIAAANVVGNDSRRLIQANVISPPLFAKEGEVSVGVTIAPSPQLPLPGLLSSWTSGCATGNFRPKRARRNCSARKADTTPPTCTGSGRTARRKDSHRRARQQPSDIGGSQYEWTQLTRVGEPCSGVGHMWPTPLATAGLISRKSREMTCM